MTLAAALFGAIIGSFINALSFRWGTGQSVMHGRSKCMRCGHTLAALDLVPILSWLMLRGRCRYCHTRISSQYPAVEAAAAALGAGVWLTTPEVLPFFFWFVVWMVLLLVVVYDLRHFIIPWSLSGLLALLLAGYLIATHASVGAWFSGIGLALPLVVLSVISRGRWMGLGDGPLELSLGFMLGFTAGLTALMLAFWVGAAVGSVLLLTQKRYTMKSELPFAPFLVVGAAAAYFLHVDIFQSLPALLF